MIKTVTLKNGKTKFVARYGHGGKQRRFDTIDDARRYVRTTTHPNHKLRNRPTGGQAWPRYVVPTAALAAVVEQHINTIAPGDNEDTQHDGRLFQLGQKIGDIRRVSTEACLRRLYDVTHRTTTVVQADFADATCLAFGLDIDRDANLPTLPGNRAIAKQLVAERAAYLGVTLSPKMLAEYADRTHRLGLLIVSYPHNAERLRDLAPFDCLRGYK